MKHRLLDLILLIAALIGGYFAWQTGQERSRLEGQYERLSRKTGDLRITDPLRVHVLALDTGDPLHFAWRVYLPANYQANLQRTGGSSSSWSSDPQEFIARVRFLEDEQGVLNVYTSFKGGSSRASVGGPELAELLRGRWEEIQVEQLGAVEMAAIAPDQSARLLRLTLPETLEQEALEKLPARDLKRQVPVLFDWELSPGPFVP